MDLLDSDQDKIRQELKERMKELVNLRCDGQSRKINIVPKYWHDSLINWIQDGSKPIPGPIDNTSLFLYNGELDVTKIYKKDYMIVDTSIWTFLANIFTCKKPITRKITSHPITGCTVALLSPVVLEIIIDKNSLYKTCSPDWLLGELRRPLCTALRIVFNEHTFVSYETNKIIDDKMKIGDCSKKYGTKVKLIEKDLNNKSSEKGKIITNYNKNIINQSQTSKYSHLTFEASAATKSTVSKTNCNDEPSLSSIINGQVSTKHASSTYQIKEPKPVGLINTGNTCFFNASIQCIIRIPPLYQYILSPAFSVSVNKNNPHGSGGIIANEFSNFLMSMSLSSTAVRDPRNLRRAILTKYKEFANNDQQDAQEMVYAILDGLHEDLYKSQLNDNKKIEENNINIKTNDKQNSQTNNNNGNSNGNHILNRDILNKFNNKKECVTTFDTSIQGFQNSNISYNSTSRPTSRLTPRSTLDPHRPSSIIEEIFFGKLSTQTVCPNCESVEMTTDPFLFLSVPIPATKTTTPPKSKYSFTFDNEESESSVSLKDCIQLFLKSGQLDENNKWKCPNCKTNVCAFQNTEISKVGEILIIHLKRFEQTMNGTMKKIDTKVNYPPYFYLNEIAPSLKNKKYKLISVIYHSGSISQGHYTAAAIDPGSGHWYNFNDSYSAMISSNSIFSSRAYILFYMNVNE